MARRTTSGTNIPEQVRMGCSVAGYTLIAVFAAWTAAAAEDWLQYKFDSRHSGDARDRRVDVPLGLVGAVPLTDAVFTAPVISAGVIYVVDGAGVTKAVDAESLEVVWEFRSHGGKANTGNVSSPAVVGRFLHFGTTAGIHYVLDKSSGKPVREISCGEPIFSTPVVANDRVYFVTLGSRVYALEPDGTRRWVWDFVEEKLGFAGDRFSGESWQSHRKGKVTPHEQFLCARNLAVDGSTLVVPTGGSLVWLDDEGDRPEERAWYVPQRPTPTLGLSIGPDGSVYRQWHFLDNRGQVDRYRLPDGNVAATAVSGTETSIRGGLLSFSSVSVRGDTVYRTRPEDGFGLCAHLAAEKNPTVLSRHAAIAPPILSGDSAIYGTLDGYLRVVPLSGGRGTPWSFKTAFGKAISAPVAVCDGRIAFGCEDGYLYVLGRGGKAELPTDDLGLTRIRSPLRGEHAVRELDRATSFGNASNANADNQGLHPPFQLKWIRRFEGSTKHFSTFGGGRMYTHTAEGQVFAVEEETGRLLWRVYYPGVHICYTSALYHDERLLVPQAGLRTAQLRCLDAASGKLLWEAPFGGSPSWNRQLPPVVHENIAIYMFSTGNYGADAPLEDGEQSPGWLFEHQNVVRFPRHHRPMLRAYDLANGETVWEKDFSDYGAGGDEAGVCVLGGKLYYTAFFGRAAVRRGKPGPKGLTAALDPTTGEILWTTTEHFMAGGCTISGNGGRLYLGGYNPIGDTQSCHVWCLDSRDGSLIWRSEPLLGAIQVVTVGPRFLFAHAQYQNGYLIDKETGKIITTLTEGYKCTRFTLSEPFLLGSNMDVIDLSKTDHIRLVSTGPRLDPSECVGAVVSNGRLFYTGHGSGLQACQVFGDEAKSFRAPWSRRRSRF